MLSRADARAIGKKRYFTAKPCPRGHVCDRNVSNSDCVECNQERRNAWAETMRGREILLRLTRESRFRNRHKRRDAAKAEYLKHPETGRANSANARARVIGDRRRITGEDILSVLSEQLCKCSRCASSLSEYYEVDHMIPLRLGGQNAKENLQCLCFECHSTKTKQDIAA